jgi:hypothetical protein
MAERKIQRVRTITANPRTVGKSAAYTAGFNAMIAATGRHGTTNLSPSTAQRDEWRSDWAQYMRGWNEAKKRKYHENPKKNGRNNPSEYAAAVAASEEFHGTKAHEVLKIQTEIFEHDNLGDIGELVSIDIAAVNGGIVKLAGFEGARLARSPKGFPYQLFIEGGDQSVDLAEFGIEDAHEFEVLGRLKRIKYYTVKHHLGKEGGEANYFHKLGELSGKLPHVIYDTVNQLLSIAGGEYTILPEGIDN